MLLAGLPDCGWDRYGTGEPELVFVERKTHRDSWTGDVSVKERFIIKPREVPLLLNGQFPIDEKIAEMRKKGSAYACARRGGGLGGADCLILDCALIRQRLLI